MNDSATLSPTCPRCGASLATDAPEGLCPRCLAALQFGSETAFTGAAGTPPLRPPLRPEELAPIFPQLEILECLGRGGMGVVYKARQKSLDRLVALKLLAPERERDAAFAERFAREARALAALNHPNIVTIHDFGEAGGFYYLLMEFVDGVNLRQAMKLGRFTPEQALAIVPPVCEALQAAHGHGIVHRDIKPENLLLDKEGHVKIADFGIAKMLHAEDSGIGLTETQPAGTPQYMAPEQKEHRLTDHRADIYSLGVVLYELLTGELPARQLQPPSRKVQIDVRLDEIVLRALEKTPELRYQTAAELRTQVETVIGTAVEPRPPVSPNPASSERNGPRTVKIKTLALAGSALAVFVLFLVLLWAARSSRVRSEMALAEARAREAEIHAQSAPANVGRPSLFAGHEVLAAELQQAQAEAALIERRVEAGQADVGERDAARDKVAILEAELAGNPVQAARVELEGAKRKLSRAGRLYAAGVLTSLDLQKTKSDVAIAEARLKEAEANAAAPASPPAGR